jgi:F-type H+-transporting ATPase subunit alpha
MKLVAERLKIDYSRFMEVEVFTRFGAHVEEETAKLLRRGERMREMLKQPRFRPFSVEEEILSLMILESGVLDSRELNTVDAAASAIRTEIKTAFPALVDRIRTGGDVSSEDFDRLREFIRGAPGQA